MATASSMPINMSSSCTGCSATWLEAGDIYVSDPLRFRSFDEQDGKAFIAMEASDGATLKQRIARARQRSLIR